MIKAAPSYDSAAKGPSLKPAALASSANFAAPGLSVPGTVPNEPSRSELGREAFLEKVWAGKNSQVAR